MLEGVFVVWGARAGRLLPVLNVPYVLLYGVYGKNGHGEDLNLPSRAWRPPPVCLGLPPGALANFRQEFWRWTWETACGPVLAWRSGSAGIHSEISNFFHEI